MHSNALLPGQLRLVLAIALVHVLAWFAYYSQIPAGQYPGEEARATLDAALTMAVGAPDPDTRHSLYTGTLSVLARFFYDPESLTSAARGLNALALLITTGLCATAAGHYWRRNRAIWVTGLFIGLNPLLVFWAGEVSPALPATACMSLALWRIFHWLRRPKISDSLWIGLGLSLAALFQTVLLPLALLWPALAGLFPRRERPLHLILALLPLAAGGLLLVSGLQLQSPFTWKAEQLGMGLYQALGSTEGYDGKSFGLYRQLHLILFLNPIHWGLLLLLATGGAYARLKDGHRGRSVLLALSTLALFALSFALNESGSQARASLIPLLAIFAAGVTLLPKIWHHASKCTRRKIVIGALLVGLFTYADLIISKPQRQTWERDYVYLAEANIQLGNNALATTWATKALELNPARSDMQVVLTLAQFNHWAMGSQPQTLPIEDARARLEASRQIAGNPTTRAIEGIYLYKLREVDTANALWQTEREESALARLCLYWTGTETEPSPSEIRNLADSPYYDLLQEALKIDRHALAYGESEKRLDNILAFSY